MLLANGHPEAAFYPLGAVVDEAALVSERINGLMATQAVLAQVAAATLYSKEAGGEFEKLIARLTNG